MITAENNNNTTLQLLHTREMFGFCLDFAFIKSTNSCSWFVLLTMNFYNEIKRQKEIKIVFLFDFYSKLDLICLASLHSGIIVWYECCCCWWCWYVFYASTVLIIWFTDGILKSWLRFDVFYKCHGSAKLKSLEWNLLFFFVAFNEWCTK